MQALQKHHDNAGAGDSIIWMAGVVGQLTADLVALRDEFGIPDVSAAAVPEWIES